MAGFAGVSGEYVPFGLKTSTGLLHLKSGGRSRAVVLGYREHGEKTDLVVLKLVRARYNEAQEPVAWKKERNDNEVERRWTAHVQALPDVAPLVARCFHTDARPEKFHDCSVYSFLGPTLHDLHAAAFLRGAEASVHRGLAQTVAKLRQAGVALTDVHSANACVAPGGLVVVCDLGDAVEPGSAEDGQDDERGLAAVARELEVQDAQGAGEPLNAHVLRDCVERTLDSKGGRKLSTEEQGILARGLDAMYGRRPRSRSRSPRRPAAAALVPPPAPLAPLPDPPARDGRRIKLWAEQEFPFDDEAVRAAVLAYFAPAWLVFLKRRKGKNGKGKTWDGALQVGAVAWERIAAMLAPHNAYTEGTVEVGGKELVFSYYEDCTTRPSHREASS